MSACHRFCDELTNLAFSGRTREVIIERSTLMLRFVLEANGKKAEAGLEGFRRELLDATSTASPSGEQFAHPANYLAGEKAGQALGQAMMGKIDRATLRTRLRAILCES